MNRRDIEGMRTEGERGFMNLCKLACALGYKDPCHQMMNKDGSCVGDLICFFEDNPGAIEAIKEWVLAEYNECACCKQVTSQDECHNGCDSCEDCGNELEECECDDEEEVCDACGKVGGACACMDLYGCPCECKGGCEDCNKR